jgi:RNase P/RNase MRP subunit p29
MNVIGERVTVVRAKDPAKEGRKGEIVLETANTVLIETDGHKFRVEKGGTVFQVRDSKKVIMGQDIAGRLEDRLGRKKK